MVIHYEPGRLRRNSDQPTAITNVLITSPSSSRPGEIPLGAPTCSARTRHGSWALYPNGADVVVVWPGGALAGPPADVAHELGRLGDNAHDALDPAAEDGAKWPAPPARVWSRPAVGYRLSGPANQPGHDAHTPASWPGAPAPPPHPLIPLPDPRPKPAPAR